MTDSLKSLLAYRIIGGTIAAAIMLLLVWLFPGMTRHDAQYVGAAIVGDLHPIGLEDREGDDHHTQQHDDVAEPGQERPVLDHLVVHPPLDEAELHDG